MSAKCWETIDLPAFLLYLEASCRGTDFLATGISFLDQVSDNRTSIDIDEIYSSSDAANEPTSQVAMRAALQKSKTVAVRANQEVRFSLDLPPGFHGSPVSAILLELDSSGALSLLSSASMVGPNLSFEDRVEVPSSLVIKRCSASLVLGVVGESTIYGIVSRASLSDIPVFARTRMRQVSSSGDVDWVRESDIDDIISKLLSQSPKDWFVVKRTIAIKD